MERSIECGQCKKPIKIIYKEVVGNTVTSTEMCADCPVLQQKLGIPSSLGETLASTHLICGHCKTSLESILRGEPVGCSECYIVFAERLIAELIARGEIPEHLVKNLKTQKMMPLHVGKTPNATTHPSLSDQLRTLNASLHESLKLENYEQAAWLRDKIKALQKKPNTEQ